MFFYILSSNLYLKFNLFLYSNKTFSSRTHIMLYLYNYKNVFDNILVDLKNRAIYFKMFQSKVFWDNESSVGNKAKC